MNNKKVKNIVRESYAKIVKQKNVCCIPDSSCCGDTDLTENISEKIGYSKEDLNSVPEGANLHLGCGNPLALASLKKGDTVLDLGSGAGFDCFLAANKVGESGRVIGIDMTPEMVKKAQNIARKNGYTNVEFKLGDIENLPVDNDSVDFIISNCVINLTPDKRKTFKEAFRVLRSTGKLMISDIVLLKELPSFVKDSIDAYVGCISGAILKDEYLEVIETAGFKDVKIIEESEFPIDFVLNDQTVKNFIEKIDIPLEKIKESVGAVSSIKVSALKP